MYLMYIKRLLHYKCAKKRLGQLALAFPQERISSPLKELPASYQKKSLIHILNICIKNTICEVAFKKGEIVLKKLKKNISTILGQL